MLYLIIGSPPLSGHDWPWRPLLNRLDRIGRERHVLPAAEQRQQHLRAQEPQYTSKSTGWKTGHAVAHVMAVSFSMLQTSLASHRNISPCVRDKKNWPGPGYLV